MVLRRAIRAVEPSHRSQDFEEKLRPASNGVSPERQVSYTGNSLTVAAEASTPMPPTDAALYPGGVEAPDRVAEFSLQPFVKRPANPPGLLRSVNPDSPTESTITAAINAKSRRAAQQGAE